MKKITIVAATLISMIACTEKDGHMYKAYHSFRPTSNNHQELDTLYATDFFYMETNDDGAAWAWYKQTKAYETWAPISDSTWIEYHCTYEEWQENRL